MFWQYGFTQREDQIRSTGSSRLYIDVNVSVNDVWYISDLSRHVTSAETGSSFSNIP